MANNSVSDLDDDLHLPMREGELERCFHCGQDVPFGTSLSVQMDGQTRRVCCVGCQAVSSAIINGGLADYYRRREAFPEASVADFSGPLKELGLYDQEDFQKAFVLPVGDGEREADLILEGISCAACVWLNERHILSLGGVTAVQVNYATRRARVRWRVNDIRLSQILAAIAAIGYRAYPFDPERFENIARKEQRTALQRLFVAGFGMMQVMMYAYPAYIAADGEMSAQTASLLRWAGLVLTVPVMSYSASPIFVRAWRGMRELRLGMDFPVALGLGLSFAASVWATAWGGGEVYFDSVTMFVFFLLGGRYLEMLARQRAARTGDALGRVVPQFARRLSPSGELEEQVPASSILAGDQVIIRPGEVVVVDGLVRSGESEVDESWLTGESVPVPKTCGDAVLSGCLNGSGSLVVEARQVGESTQFAVVRRLIERASATRPRIVVMADRISAYFTWVLLALAVGTVLWWWRVDAAQALPVLVSVLVVSCPCALSLATPISMTIAVHVLARRGVLVTRPHAIETLASARHYVFDKTGTLTEGRQQLEQVLCQPGFEPATALSIAAALEEHSEHSLARVLTAEAERCESALDVRVFPGKGVTGTVRGIRCALGSGAFVESWCGSSRPDRLMRQEETTQAFLASESTWVAKFSFSDKIRPVAGRVVRALQQQNCQVSMLSGDSEAPVRSVARQLKIENAHAALLPEEKQALMRRYQSAGDTVVMVGDGVNDAPAMAQAHVSVAMAGGAELARNQADIILLANDLRRLEWARGVATASMVVVRQNLFWALAYNLSVIPAAMMGLVTPWFAGLGMGLSSVLVVLNALRISVKGERLWKTVSTS
ncbi:MAG: hypothetical protein RJA63_1528 [Pseudomonadota bacterium]